MEPRVQWTDQRLDDLNKKVDHGFERLDKDIREVRGDIKDLKSEMSARFAAVNRNIWAGTITVAAALIGSQAFF